MKTAMTELIEDCQQNLSGIAISVQEKGLNGFEKQHYQSTAKCLHTIIQKCCELLAKEKEQIVDAFKSGQTYGSKYEYPYPNETDYFNQTYKQK